MAQRKAPTLQEKLSAALLALDDCRCKLDPTLQASVDREKAKLMTAKQVEQAMNLEWDHHPIPVAWDGTNHPTNLKPLRKADHREKTNKKDKKAIAKVARIHREGKFVVKRSAVFDEAGGMISAAFIEKKQEKKKWPSRPMPGGTKSNLKRGFNGKVSARSSSPSLKSR